MASLKKSKSLHRSLKTRHLFMIAMGGSIGTGLFVASGVTLSKAGPGGAFCSYILVGIMVYFVMTSLGELAAFMPVSGSFSTYGQIYVEEGFGFALGWNYWYNWAITIAVDLVASQLVMTYWFPNIPGWIWSISFLGILFSLNWVSVRGFGEAEYWLSLIKVVTVLIFIITGLVILSGFFKTKELANWDNWTAGKAPFSGGFLNMISVAMIVGFSFQGTELVGIAAGESENPKKSIPLAVKRIFWRILIFYILAILIISVLIPYTDPNLLKSDIKHISISPFTLIFQYIGFRPAATLMNVVIVTAILSSGNSGMYASTRMLYTLSCEGKAPKVFKKLSRNGVPRNALYATTIVAAMCFLTSTFGNKIIYLWLLNTSAMTGFIAWLGITLSHYRFRKGYLLQGNDINALPYRSKFFPAGSFFSIFLCSAIIFGQGFKEFFQEDISWINVLKNYISIFIFLAIWGSYRYITSSRLIKYEEMKFLGK